MEGKTKLSTVRNASAWLVGGGSSVNANDIVNLEQPVRTNLLREGEPYRAATTAAPVIV
jgi:hypothetical protein